MRILVAGATGVVGRRVVPLLLGAGHRVTAIGRSEEKLAPLEPKGTLASRVDLFDAEAVRAAALGCDAIVSLATHMPASAAA